MNTPPSGWSVSAPKRRSGYALYLQLADELRNLIVADDPERGMRLPSEAKLAEMTGLGRDTVRDALAVLRAEGLVVTERGLGTSVRESRPVDILELPAGAAVRTRMPTPEERSQLDLQ